MLAESDGRAALGGGGMGWGLFGAAKGGVGTSATGDKRTEGQKDDGVEDDLVDGMHYLGRGLGEVEYTAAAVGAVFRYPKSTRRADDWVVGRADGREARVARKRGGEGARQARQYG